MSGVLAEFERLLAEKGKGFVKAQIIWGTVKDVDWDKKQMTVTSTADNLDYFKVQLGIGSMYRKPKVGTKAVIALINNKDAGILLHAEAFEEQVVTSGKSEFIIKESGYIINQDGENLGKVISDFMDEVSKIIVVNGTTINVGAVTAIKQRLNSILIQ